MDRGADANRAVEETIRNIRKMRQAHDGLDRIIFCFPRVKQVGDSEYKDGVPFAVAAAAIARDPSSRVNDTVRIAHYGEGHPIPSCFVPLQGISDVEYHVSKQDMERLFHVNHSCR